MCQEDQVESSKCMLNAKDEEYLIMVTGRDKELRILSGRLSKLQNEFDLLAVPSKANSKCAEVVESELELTKESVRKANATISEFKVNEHNSYSCICNTCHTNMIFLLVNHRIT